MHCNIAITVTGPEELWQDPVVRYLLCSWLMASTLFLFESRLGLPCSVVGMTNGLDTPPT